LFANVDVKSQVQAALPPKGQFLATPLEGTLQTFTFTATRRALQSDRFQRLWENANRRIHHQVVNLLTGKGKLVKNGQVVIPTADVLARAKTALNAKGVHIFDDVTLPPDKEQLVLFDSPDLVKVQGAVNVFQKIAWGMPIVAVLCLGGAVFLSKDRRRALVVVALAVAFSVGLLLVLYGLGRGLYLDAVSSPKLPRDAAAGVWDSVTTALKTAGRTVFALALVVAFGAWVMGPAKLATRLREAVRRVITGAGSAAGEPGAVAEYVGRHRGGFVGGGIVVALLVLVVWSAPTPLTILVITLVLLVYLGVVAFLARDAESAETVSSSST
jgi:cytochrome c-type biogenesis protein CcmH/NrfF